MEPNIKEIGKKTRHVEKENLFMQMEIIMKVSGKMIKLMDSVHMSILKLERVTKVIGKMIWCTVLEFKFILMEISIKVCSNKEREADKELTIFHKDKFIKGNGIMVKLRVLEYVSGQMEDIMKVIG
jgi:hypothetical protein